MSDEDTSQPNKAHRVLTDSSVGSVYVDDETQKTEDREYDRGIPDREMATTPGPTIPAKRQPKEPDRYKPEVKSPKKPNLDINIEEKALVDIPGMSNIDGSIYSEIAHQIPKDGLMPLIKAGLQHEIEAKTPIGSFGNDKQIEDIWTDACTQTFCQMDSRVLLHCIAGNIAQVYVNSKMKGGGFAQYLEKLYERSAIQPSCYVRTLSDKMGRSISPDDLSKLMVLIHGYASRAHEQDAESCAIDTCMQPDRTTEDSIKGKRYFLETDASEISVPRVKLVRAWCQAINERLKHCNTSGKTLEPPLQYVGYALNAQKRQAQHDGSSTSWFTELVKAACKVLFGDKYAFTFHVVCLIDNEIIGPWTEAILSRFMRAYATDGGFSIAWAGVSTKSLGLGNWNPSERQQYWARMTEWVAKETPLYANIKLETTRRRGYHDRLLAQEKAEIHAERDKIVDGQRDFVRMALRTHELLERDRERYTREMPDKVEKADRNYELAVEIQDVWRRHEALKDKQS
jgi:hypothetical protein